MKYAIFFSQTRSWLRRSDDNRLAATFENLEAAQIVADVYGGEVVAL